MSSTPHASSPHDDDTRGPFDRDPHDRPAPRAADHGDADDRGDDYRAADQRAADYRAADYRAANQPMVGGTDRVRAEEAEYGGVKPGAAFFGWLTATGMAVLLTALLAAAGTALGLATGTDLGEAASDAAGEATANPEGVGAAGIIGLGVIMLVAYYCGGYVAGRMARFQGARQGVAVWVWALVVAALVGLLGFVAGEEYNVLERLDGFPRIPVDEGTLTTAGVIALVVALVASLVGAILGGIAGVRYHRKVDRAGLVAG